METNLINSTPEEDRTGIDAWFFDIPMALRKRTISITDHNDISIRGKGVNGYTPVEGQKMLSGLDTAQLYVFRFTDYDVILVVDDIKKCLQEGKFREIPNKDGSAGWYINLDILPHLLRKR